MSEVLIRGHFRAVHYLWTKITLFEHIFEYSVTACRAMTLFFGVSEASAMAPRLGNLELYTERFPDLTRGNPPRERLIRRRPQRGYPVVAEEDAGVRFSKLFGYRTAESSVTHRALAGDKF